MKLSLLNPLLVAGLLAWTSFAAKADQELGSHRHPPVQRHSPSRRPTPPVDCAWWEPRARFLPLAALLSNEATAHAARHALEGIPVPEAGAALRRAFPASAGLLRVGLIDSLGWRGEPEAVPLLEAVAVGH